MPIGETLAATVPTAGTLNLEFLGTAPEKAVAALPDQGDFHGARDPRGFFRVEGAL